MKITFALPTDNRRHDYCWYCKAEALMPTRKGEQEWFLCRACRKQYPRAITIDPEIEWWLKAQVYWHKSVGIFVGDMQERFLFFERLKFPFGLTIPAGHAKRKEKPVKAAYRELLEETGIKAKKLKHLKTCDIEGDQCRRGADDHVWSLYGLQLTDTVTYSICPKEGTRPRWLTLSDALTQPLIFSTRFAIKQNFAQLQQLGR